MDKRDKLIKDFSLMGGRDVDLLIKLLQDYEVTEKCTALVVDSDSNYKLLKRFLATKRIEGKSEKTIERYHGILVRFIDWLEVPIKECSSYHIRCYLSLQKEKGLCDRTLDGMRRIYSSFFSWLDGEELIAHNPCKNVKAIKFRKEQKSPFTNVDMERIKEQCDTPRNLAIVEFLYSTGCRVSEVASINREDIDYAHKCVDVLGKGNKVRRVYLSDICLMRLVEYLDTRTDTNPCLFLGAKNRRLREGGIRTAITKAGHRAGVTKTHPHRYRRTLATNLLDRGMGIQDVAAILGHEDLKTTQIYCYINQKHVENAYRQYV